MLWCAHSSLLVLVLAIRLTQAQVKATSLEVWQAPEVALQQLLCITMASLEGMQTAVVFGHTHTSLKHYRVPRSLKHAVYMFVERCKCSKQSPLAGKSLQLLSSARGGMWWVYAEGQGCERRQLQVLQRMRL